MRHSVTSVTGRSVGVALAATLSLSLLASSPASAFIQGNLCPARQTNNYFFSDGNGTERQRAEVRAAAAEWERGVDFDGSRLLTLREGLTATAIRVDFTDDFNGTDTNGSVNNPDCSTLKLANKLSVEPRTSTLIRPNTGSVLRSVATHEFGHFLGLNHSGREDGFRVGDMPDLYPAMATCGPSEQSYKQDDEAAAAYLHSSLFPRALVGNLGFERGDTIWTRSGSSSVISYKADATRAANGAVYAHYRNVAGSDHLYQTINFSSLVSQARQLQAVANFRLPPTSYSATAAGTARVELVLNYIKYPAEDASCESFIDDRDHNNRPTPAGFVIVRTRACTITYTFTPCATDGFVAEYQDDVKTRMYSDVKNGAGVLIGVEVDDLRTRDIA